MTLAAVWTLISEARWDFLANFYLPNIFALIRYSQNVAAVRRFAVYDVVKMPCHNDRD